MARQQSVVVEDLHKSFGDLQVLKGVSLSASEGDVISMIGSSGSGKSTFLRCINLLEMPDSGRVYVGDEFIRMKKNRRGEMCLWIPSRLIASARALEWSSSFSTSGRT